MTEVWLFGWLVVTLPSAVSVVLVIVALTSVTYLAMTLSPVLRLPGHDGPAKRLGTGTALGALATAALGLRVGSSGSGGELIPSLAVGVAAAAACGATATFATLGSARAWLALGAARSGRRSALDGARQREARRLTIARNAWLEGADLHAEVAEAEAAVARLRAALEKLAQTREAVEKRLAALDQASALGDLGRELRHARDDVAMKLDLGNRILGAAAAAAFRIACGEPLRLLLRRRPRDVTQGLGGPGDAAAAAARLDAAAAAINAFLLEAQEARRRLEEVEVRRPPGGKPADEGDDPLALAGRDIDAVEEAYTAVRSRLEVVRVRREAHADMEMVASAAGEVSQKAQASGLDAGDLQGLVDEVSRAESAILMAMPGELDAQGLTDALARSTVALGGSDGASLDELLRALREVV
jgi:hypothetical protein